jgi:hypothetical protein
MTQKHVIALSAALVLTRPVITPKLSPAATLAWAERVAQWETDVVAVAATCARLNPRFNRPAFLRACGLERKP